MGYTAGIGGDNIRGIGNNPPYFYPVAGLSASTTAVTSLAGMDGANGGWAVLYGEIPVLADGIDLAVDEDQVQDTERNHTTEQIGYIVLE